ncbi:pseudouridine synthase [Acutalibacter sp. 1XD8-36]|uniref:pseudouridine synthase n=1 Tax=Acutalibacter sp. 1XD8-36 TaxID=2320852 RepID=UPI001412C2D4|nr:pseudouridine synthase [Acutalibacter sp. 1XD8-36]NBJ90540.1 rRNA pseudouridine synthase [Acutalibacter sp. 1XD8-36]
MAQSERVQKLIAQAGIASRRKAEELIQQGRVTVNGRPIKLGDSARPNKDVIAVDGQRIANSSGKIYLALHKPRGFVTTMEDERGRKCVAQLVEDVPGRVYPVGRLDKDSEGLLIMTNDGNLANAVSHPKTHVAKTYRVTLRPGITEEQLIKLSTGIMLDGRMTAPAKARVLEQQPGRAVVEIVLYEGRNREIRRMCESMGLEVARLKRTAIGPVRLSMLPQGRHRELSREEIAGLLAESGKGRSR